MYSLVILMDYSTMKSEALENKTTCGQASLGQSDQQMGVQVPCEHPPFKGNIFIFHISLYKFFISADAIAHDLDGHF